VAAGRGEGKQESKSSRSGKGRDESADIGPVADFVRMEFEQSGDLCIAVDLSLGALKKVLGVDIRFSSRLF